MAPTLLVALAVLQAAAPLSSDRTRPRVRPEDGCARALVADGEQASPTVAGLLTSLEASDVVVYLRCGAGLPHRGSLTFVAHGGPLTYVLVRVDVGQPRRERIATLAHELTHATEVASARPPLETEAGLERLYRAIGIPGERKGEFESRAALANERQVKAEMWIAAARPRTPSER